MKKSKSASIEISVSTDNFRGAKRYLFEWEGYQKEVFMALKKAGATTDKVDDKWVVWTFANKFHACIDALDKLPTLLESNFDIDEELETILDTMPEPYEVIKIETQSITLHFAYNDAMLNALRRIPSSGREFDNYTNDWTIKHEHLPILIAGWRALNIPVKRLEDIQTIVRY